MSDPINHPSHYTFGKYEVIDVIEDWGLGFHLGCAVKYISRAGRKTDDARQDLQKARWYLERELSRLEQAAQRVEAKAPANYPYSAGIPLGRFRCPHLFSPAPEKKAQRCVLDEGHEGDHQRGPQ